MAGKRKKAPAAKNNIAENIEEKMEEVANEDEAGVDPQNNEAKVGDGITESNVEDDVEKDSKKPLKKRGRQANQGKEKNLEVKPDEEEMAETKPKKRGKASKDVEPENTKGEENDIADSKIPKKRGGKTGSKKEPVKEDSNETELLHDKNGTFSKDLSNDSPKSKKRARNMKPKDESVEVKTKRPTRAAFVAASQKMLEISETESKKLDKPDKSADPGKKKAKGTKSEDASDVTQQPKGARKTKAKTGEGKEVLTQELKIVLEHCTS